MQGKFKKIRRVAAVLYDLVHTFEQFARKIQDSDFRKEYLRFSSGHHAGSVPDMVVSE